MEAQAAHAAVAHSSGWRQPHASGSANRRMRHVSCNATVNVCVAFRRCSGRTCLAAPGGMCGVCGVGSASEELSLRRGAIRDWNPTDAVDDRAVNGTSKRNVVSLPIVGDVCARYISGVCAVPMQA